MADLKLAPSHLLVRARDDRGVRIVSVGGEADLRTEHRLTDALRKVVLRSDRPLVLDLGGLRFCSAHAMGVIADMASGTAHRGVSMAVVGLTATNARVWLLTDVPIPVQYATVELAVSALSTARPGSVDQDVDVDPSTARLLAELEGLHRALIVRAVVEQATGMLMERLECTSEDAFAVLVHDSRRSHRTLYEVAADRLRSSAEAVAKHDRRSHIVSYPAQVHRTPSPEPAA